MPKNPTLNLTLSLLLGSISFLAQPISQVHALANYTCEDIQIANVTNYNWTVLTQPWTGAVQVDGFGCTTSDGSNPGPWRLAVLDQNGKVLSKTPQNGQSLKPVLSTGPTAGQTYTLACIKVKGNGNETPTGEVCPGVTLTSAAEGEANQSSPTSQTTRGGRSVTTNQSSLIDEIKDIPGVEKRLKNPKFQAIFDKIDPKVLKDLVASVDNTSCKELKNTTEVTKKIARSLKKTAGSPDQKSPDISQKKLRKAVQILTKFKCKEGVDITKLTS